MNNGLQRYLNDHLAGSESALKLTDHLISRTTGAGSGFFKGLKRSIQQDQRTLVDVMKLAGVKTNPILRLAGSLTGGAARLKLKLDPATLGDFESLEMLSLGIQGKRLLWRILDEISPSFPQWQGIDFIQLEKDALMQRDAVEDLRIHAGKEALAADRFAMSEMRPATNPATSEPQ